VQNETPLPKPAHFIPKEEMVKLLTEMHLLEATITLRNSQNQNHPPKDTLSVKDVFTHYGETPADFKENFQYYASKPALVSEIYDEVISELTRRQAEERKK
jgi:hypothetical protein